MNRRQPYTDLQVKRNYRCPGCGAAIAPTDIMAARLVRLSERQPGYCDLCGSHAPIAMIR